MARNRAAPRHKSGSYYARHKIERLRRDVKRLAVATVVALGLTVTPAALADAGFDNASWQGCYSAGQARAAGASFSITKLTEGPGYENEYAGCQIATNREAGLRMAAYDFAQNGLYTATASADNFTRVAQKYGLVHAGVIPVLDWEPAGNLKRDVGWAKTWLDRVQSEWGVKPLIYMSANTIQMADWTPVAGADYGLWVAGYPRGYQGERLRDPGPPPYDLGPWGFAAAWQYSSSGLVPGVGTAVDVDWFYGDAVTWSKYADAPVGSAQNPVYQTPDPSQVRPAQGAPTADGNTLADEVIRGEFGNDPTRRQLLGSRYDEVMAIVNRRMGHTGSSGGYYVVKPNDYLSKIWPQNWRSVASLNGISWPYTIYPGERIYTGGASSWDHSVRVRPGDTLSAIAARLGISPSQIHGYRSGNPNLIYPDEVLTY
ncbi:GH25 family lysozyme [Bifidobacterium sp. ESL0790]|uniref:GH25 family lysozyme n=1 Tax=Bifidobacterium sp. ESL0790 TaxID=2983233 RepID=UPI0023F82D9B|nr:GH25 family lysozyme [Bifidobacterium sp. ESL0790]WEV72163.1 GH25 family lysozyme [Bifidobacterium sp. ESL0790]